LRANPDAYDVPHHVTDGKPDIVHWYCTASNQYILKFIYHKVDKTLIKFREGYEDLARTMGDISSQETVEEFIACINNTPKENRKNPADLSGTKESINRDTQQMNGIYIGQERKNKKLYLPTFTLPLAISRKFIIDLPADLSTISNFSALPVDIKKPLLEANNQEIKAEILAVKNKKKVFEGIVFIVTGEFDSLGLKKEDLIMRLVSEGAEYVQTLTVKANAVVLGKDAIIGYGNVTGRGSKKFKEAKKKNCWVIDFTADKEWIQHETEEYKKTGITSLERHQAENKASSSTIVNKKKRKSPEPLVENDEKGKKKAKVDTIAKEEDDTEKKVEGYDLKNMTRKELQNLAKVHNIKANLSSDEIIVQLLSKTG